MWKRRLHSFLYAGRGIGQVLRREPNMRIHALATVVMTGLGLVVGISRWEWAAQWLAIGLVWSTEIINTVWENYLDELHPERSPTVGRLKDMAAGAVLVAALTAVAVGITIYGPRIWSLL